MIKPTERNYTQAVYCAECSECGEEGPDALTTLDATIRAHDEGWITMPGQHAGLLLVLHICPECQGNEQTDQERSEFTQEYDEFTDADPGL